MPNVPLLSKLGETLHIRRDVIGSARRRRLFRRCLGLGLLALVLLLWLLGLNWWTLLIAALVMACPVMAAWLFLGGLDEPPRTDR